MAKNELITFKTCGASVAKDAKNCPSCGARTKKPFSKTFSGRLLKYIFILYIFIAVDFTLNGRALPNANASNGTSSTTEENSNADATTDSTENTEAEVVADDTQTDAEQTSIPATDETSVQTQNENTSVESSTNVEQAPTTNQDGTVAPVKIGQ